MKIMFIIISEVPFGSNDLLAYKAAEELVRLGHQVLVSPWDWGDRNAFQYEQIRKNGALLVMRGRQVRKDIFLLRQLAKVRHRLRNPLKDWQFATEFCPEAIVISDPGTYHFLSVPGLIECLKEREVPFFTISQYHDENRYMGERDYRKARSVFANARRCFFVSCRNLQVARRQLCSDLPHALVVGNPPNLHDWSYVPFPDSERAHYCMLARLECAVKGQALVLQVLSEPVWQKRDWSLSIFGTGPDEAYLRDLIKYLRLGEKVHMCGFADDVRRVWNSQQILILASSGEGRPLALAEAMVCGRPAVVTDVGGNAELVSDGVTGFIAQSATLASVRDALERSWAERNSWAKMGLRAHDWVVRALDPPPAKLVARSILDAMASRTLPGARQEFLELT